MFDGIQIIALPIKQYTIFVPSLHYATKFYSERDTGSVICHSV